MFRKLLPRILCIYFAISLLLMIACLGIAVADCANKAREGEFMLLPDLNLAQFKTDGTHEEIKETLAQVVSYLQQKYGDDYFYHTYGSINPLWRFINISTVLSLCNLPFFFALRFFNVNLPRRVLAFILAGCVVALFLIFAARIYLHGTYGTNQLKHNYPAAFFALNYIVQTIFIAGAASGIIKLYGFLKKNENRIENQNECEDD